MPLRTGFDVTLRLGLIEAYPCVHCIGVEADTEFAATLPAAVDDPRGAGKLRVEEQF